MVNQCRKHHDSGFSLIELIVVLAIMAIISTVAFSMYLYGNRSFYATTEKAQKQYDVRMPTDFIAKSIRYADQIAIKSTIPAVPTPNAHQIYVDGTGKLVYKKAGVQTSILGTSDSINYKLTATKKSGTSNIVTLVVGISGTNSYDLVTDVEVLNLSTMGITGDASGVYLEFFTTEADSVTPLSITSVIDPITINVAETNVVSMPLRITANMSDGSQRQVAVKWNPLTIDTSSPGSKLAVGSVVGYADTATFRVIVGPVTIATVADINVTTYQGSSYVMPTRVVATTDDGDDIEVPVSSWTPTISTSTPGTYTSVGSVSGYSGTFTLTVEVTSLSISSIPNLTVTVDQGVSYTLPTDVNATMSDGSVQSRPVTWSPDSIDTMTHGIKSSTGTVAGYGTVTLTLTVVQRRLPTPACTIVSTGNNGSVKVTGLSGATVALRKSNGQILGSGVIATNGEVLISGVNTSNLHDALLSMSGWTDSVPFIF